MTNNLQVAPKFFKEIGSIEESKTNVTLSLENGVKELIQEGKDRKYLGTGWADLKVQEESEEEVKAVAVEDDEEMKEGEEEEIVIKVPCYDQS